MELCYMLINVTKYHQYYKLSQQLNYVYRENKRKEYCISYNILIYLKSFEWMLDWFERITNLILHREISLFINLYIFGAIYCVAQLLIKSLVNIC